MASMLDEVMVAMRAWQHDGPPVPLHPGDLGWHWRFGEPAVAAALRTWRRGGELAAVGMVDSPGLLRLAVAPDARDDVALARRIAADLAATGIDTVEDRAGGALHDVLVAAGWQDDEPWTPLRRDLTAPVAGCALRIEVTGRDTVAARVEVQRAAFPNSTFTAERWHTMAAGPAYADARCLVGYDDRGTAVAAATVWSAGPGRPGLLEPLGRHRDHRGHGYGTAISLAAAAALRDLGSSSATVCTPAANRGGVATYVAAGFEQLPDVPDLRLTRR